MRNIVRLFVVVLLAVAAGPVFSSGNNENTVADLEMQLAELEPDAHYWQQLTELFTPVEMPTMTDHRAYMLPGGLLLALHFDNMDLDKAENLNWVALGIPGKFSKSDQERIENMYGEGFAHFHDLANDTHGGEPGTDGVWFVHIAVREFNAPWGPVSPGIDYNFMPTPAPDVPHVSSVR